MPYRIQLYVAGDELSKSMLRMIDRITGLLAERFGPRIESSTRDFIAYVLTTSTVSLNPRVGAPDTLHLSTYFALETYREELKAKFGVADFPAARLDDAIYVGKAALEMVSELHELLRRSRSMSDDELMSEMKNLAAGGRIATRSSSTEMAGPADLLAEEASSKIAVKALAGKVSTSVESMNGSAFAGNVVMAGIFECLAKLERLRAEGKIDESTYRKMKEVYDSLLG